jgi:hypothetical protein
MTTHVHRAKTSKTVGFNHCVALGTEDDGKGCNPYSHGGVMMVATCSCGAIRKVNSTGRGREESSGWVDAASSECTTW